MGLPGFRLIALLVGVLAATPAVAVDFVSTNGRLSNGDFYRLVSCGALPGGPCAAPPIAWSQSKRQSLTLSIVQRDAGFSAPTVRAVRRALSAAIAEINAAGADLRITETAIGTRADILIYLQDVPQGGRITRTGLPGLDGQRIDIARFHVRWNAQRQILKAGIVLSADLSAREAASVVLEELVQTMGLIWDIRNPSYRAISIFDEDSNRVERLRGQDLLALRTHYPPRPR